MAAYPWWVWVLMTAGAIALTVWVVYPIIWIALYALGYTIFHILLLNGARARARPFRVVRCVLLSWPLAGLLEAITCPGESTQAGQWTWRPLLRFYRSR